MDVERGLGKTQQARSFDSSDDVHSKTVIIQDVMLAVLNPYDDTREFVIEMWRANPNLAKQGGAKVAMLLSQTADVPGTHDDFAKNT